MLTLQALDKMNLVESTRDFLTGSRDATTKLKDSLVIEHSCGKSPPSMGKFTIDGLFSMVMLNYQRVLEKVQTFGCWILIDFTELSLPNCTCVFHPT